MTRRSTPAALALGLTLVLAACDSAGTSPVTGVWEGEARFVADTLLPASNARVKADYTMAFRFEIVEDDGLVTGRIVATATGHRIVREAGMPGDTARFDGGAPMVHDVYGTYLRPILEVDVPDGPYEEDLWTFSVAGGRAELDRFLVSLNQITLPSGVEFDLALHSRGNFAMRRTSREEPAAAANAQTTDLRALGLSLPTPAR